jgi:hypothetical protein
MRGENMNFQVDNAHRGTNKKEVISFRKVIPANTTDVLAERIKTDGTIEQLSVKFYQGQQKALRVIPFVEHKGHMIEQMLTYPSTTDNYLAGDNDYFKYDIVIPVEYDDFVKVQAVNTDLTNEMTLVVDVTIDYFGGKQRVV